MKTARDAGVAVGVGSHTPEVVEYIEENGWDVDFYMTGFYNVYKTISAVGDEAKAGDQPITARQPAE